MLRRLFGPSRRKTSRPSTKYYRPRLEALEERSVPSVDMWWGHVNADWNTGTNWTLGRVPLPGDDVEFDGTTDPLTGQTFNNPVTLSSTVEVNSITVQNNYSKTITLNAGVKLQSWQGFNLDNNGTTVDVSFSSITCELEALGGESIFNNFDFSGARGVVAIDQYANLSVTTTSSAGTNADFYMNGSATFNNQVAVSFSGGAGIQVLASASMAIGAMNNTVLSSPAFAGIIENWGTLSYTAADQTTTSVNMPLLNHGQVSLAGNLAGEIDFTNGECEATSGYAVGMDGGSIILDKNIKVGVRGWGYYQTGGTLQIGTAQGPANTLCRIIPLGASGKVDIYGGLITFASMGFSSLFVTSGNLTIAGSAELDSRINGQISNSCDRITVPNGSITLGGSSKLKVTNTNNQGISPNFTWNILVSPAGTAINGNFGTIDLPSGVSQPTAAQLALGSYTLNS